MPPPNRSEKHVRFELPNEPVINMTSRPDIMESKSRYPTRVRKAPVRYSEEFSNAALLPEDVGYHDLFLYESNLNHGKSAMTAQFDLFDILKQDDIDPELLDGIHPFAFAARANAEDTPYFHEAMNGPKTTGLKETMNSEIDDLQAYNAFEVVPREKAIREGKKVIDSVWSFKHKRYPDGRVKKLKARLCMHGGVAGARH